MALYVQNLSEEDVKQIEALICEPEDDLPVNRLLIILLSAEGKSVPEISQTVNLHPINVRKWIHRYTANGVDGLRSGKSPGRPPLFTNNQRRQISKIANTSPRSLGLNFSRWSLQRLRRYLIEQGVVDRISIETIRQIIQSGELVSEIR
ncbi:MAG: helix-turn-helix domain-containing protein [Caldilineaceae bacterium]|nr:helix-turn-helix domain-containing protein [Caldilineaceae bacterium]